MLHLAVPIARHIIARADEADRRAALRAEPSRRRPEPILDPIPFISVLHEALSTERPDLDALCAKAAISIERTPLAEGVAGWIDHDRRLFVVNSEAPETRQRFTIGHQLGHWLYERDRLRTHGGVSDDTSYRQLEDGPFPNPEIDAAAERRANETAIGVLMPTSIVKRLAGQGLSSDEIAGRLCISKAAMRIRLRGLGIDA